MSDGSFQRLTMIQMERPLIDLLDGDFRAAAFLTELVRLQGFADAGLVDSEDGWLRLPSEAVERLTHINERSQRRCREKFSEYRWWHERLAGLPAKKYVRIDLGVLAEDAGMGVPGYTAETASQPGGSMTADDEPLSEREAADLLGLESALRLARWRESGDAPPHETDHTGTPVYRREDVIRWRERHVFPPGEVERSDQCETEGADRSTIASEGFVYVATNPSMDCLKVGQTSQKPEQRVSQLSRQTGVPEPFQLWHAEEVRRHEDVESVAHELLSDCRVNDSREFFDCDVGTAVDAIKTANEKVNGNE